ncbi:uncharacterized protein BJX67DRAFT_367936 [Aspergillus lucknowensis]|uniref:Secreted protein n=1 Tax=Aspergillus lucknowensis TaxID=176173 RepID=A0ABR4L8U4_9EURO
MFALLTRVLWLRFLPSIDQLPVSHLGLLHTRRESWAKVRTWREGMDRLYFLQIQLQLIYFISPLWRLRSLEVDSS